MPSMAAPPCGLMIGVHAKRSEPLEVSEPLTEYVKAVYGPAEASECAEAIAEVNNRRRMMLEEDVAVNARLDRTASYFRAMSVLETRVTVSPETQHTQRLNFRWYDAFKQGSKKHVAGAVSVPHEKASVLFNIGALVSQTALATNRVASSDGLKRAAAGFQEAAGIFAMLREGSPYKAPAISGTDVSVECAAMLERLMLAQAQECFFEKVVGAAGVDPDAPAPKPNPKIAARVAMQVSAYYADAHRAVTSSSRLSGHFDKAWIMHIQGKATLFHAYAERAAAVAAKDDESGDGIGEELCRLKSALDLCADLKRYLAHVPENHAASGASDGGGGAAGLHACHRELEAALRTQHAKSSRENDTVYLARVPAHDSLPPIAPANMVNPVPQDAIYAKYLKAVAEAGELFTRLVTEAGAKSLSKYTELVDALIRDEVDKLSSASESAKAQLVAWRMPDLLLLVEGADGAVNAMGDVTEGASAAAEKLFPPALQEELGRVSELQPAAALDELAEQLESLRTVCMRELGDTLRILDDEAKEDAHMRSVYGAGWNRTESEALTTALRAQVADYETRLTQAAKSDVALAQRVANELGRPAQLPRAGGSGAAEAPGLADLLSGAVGVPAVQGPGAPAARIALLCQGSVAFRMLPKLRPTLMAGPMDASAAELGAGSVPSRLKATLVKLDELARGRVPLEESLREQKQRDNILPRLMAGETGEASSISLDDMFNAELAKYDPLKAKVQASIEEQHRLLGEASALVAEFQSAFGVSDWLANGVSRATSDLSAALGLFREMQGSFGEGIRFYASLQDAAQALLQQARDYSDARRMQKDELARHLEGEEASRRTAEQLRREEERAAAQRALNGLSLQQQQQQQPAYPGYPMPGAPPMMPPPPAYPQSPQQGGMPPPAYPHSPQHGGMPPPMPQGAYAHSAYASVPPPPPPPYAYPPPTYGALPPPAQEQQEFRNPAAR